MKRNRKTIALVLTLVMALALFAGCAEGGGGQTETSEAPSSGATGEPDITASPESADASQDTGGSGGDDGGEIGKDGLDKLTFVFPRSYELLDDAHMHVAFAMGYFEENGIDLQLETAMGVDDLKMLVSGQADVALPSSFVQIAGHEAGLPFKSVYQQDNVNIFGYCVRPDSGITSIADLAGKSITLGDPAWNTISDPILIAAGVDPSEVEYVTAGENRAQLVEAGQADAVLTWYKEFNLWQAQGMDLEWLAGEDVVQLEGSSLCFATDQIEAKNDIIGRFLKAYAMGSYFTYLNPAAATEITLERFPSIQVKFPDAMEAIKALVYIENGDDVDQNGYGWHNPEKWEAQMAACRAAGTLTRDDLTLDEIYTNEFVEVANDFDHARVEEDAANYELKPENQEYALTNPPRS